MRKITDTTLEELELLFEMVESENAFQLEKWGVQTVTPAEWLMFLGEEYGELCEAVSEHEYENKSKMNVIGEAIQVATLALKIAEMYYTQGKPHDPA